MWNVVYHRKFVRRDLSETFRYTSTSKIKAFLVYLSWRIGYTLSNYEVRSLQIYESKSDNVIILDAYRGKRR